MHVTDVFLQNLDVPVISSKLKPAGDGKWTWETGFVICAGMGILKTNTTFFWFANSLMRFVKNISHPDTDKNLVFTNSFPL